MVEENVEDNYYARFDTWSYHSYRETHCNARLDFNHDKVTGAQNLVKGIWVFEEYVEHNYYARFDIPNYHRFREMHFNAGLDINNAGLDVMTKSF